MSINEGIWLLLLSWLFSLFVLRKLCFFHCTVPSTGHHAYCLCVLHWQTVTSSFYLTHVFACRAYLLLSLNTCTYVICAGSMTSSEFSAPCARATAPSSRAVAWLSELPTLRLEMITKLLRCRNRRNLSVEPTKIATWLAKWQICYVT